MAFFDTTWYVNYGNGSSTGYYAVPVWPGALTAVSAGTWCRQLATPTVGNERCYVCVVAGTTGAAEPVWVVTRGADSAANIDGTVKWMECTGMAGPCGDLTNCPLDSGVKSATVTLGEVIQNTAGTFLFACTTGGTTSSTVPTWSTTTGATTTWNSSSVWTCIGPTSSFTATPWLYPHARKNNAATATWMAAGNTAYVASVSAETQASSISVTSSAGTAALPLKFICTDTINAPPLSTDVTTGASVSTTGANSITENFFQYVYGVNYNAGSSSNTGSIIIVEGYFDTCTLTLNNTSASSNFEFQNQSASSYNGLGALQYKNCSFVFGSTSQNISSSNPGSLFAKGCTFAGTGSVPSTLFSPNSRGNFLLQDCDLSAITGTILNAGNGWAMPSNFKAQNCKLGSGVTLTSGIFPTGWYDPYVQFHNCDNAATNYRYYFQNYFGSVQQETTRVRSGTSATNGATPLSWNMVTTSNVNYPAGPFVSEEIAQWNNLAGSSMAATCYLTTNTSLTNANFWVEIEYLTDSGDPKGATVNTRAALLASGAALAADTSSWGGAALTNKYVVTSPSFTPNMTGPVKMRIYCTAPSATIYIDPYIYGL